VIGFGGRILSSEKSTAKYINSPESDIYNKSKALYGIYFARNEIVKKDNCFLVEGYTDVISLNQAGFENVVASSGTSLTEDQIKLIKRFTPNITMLFDGDPAGIKASFRGIDLILEQGMNVKVVLFPDGEDPDSFVRKHRTSEVDEFISKKAVDFIKFKINLLLDETEGDPSGRAKLIKEIVATIAHIPDGINRSVYIRECSDLMEVPEQTLLNELNKNLRQRFNKHAHTPSEFIPDPVDKQAPPQEKEIVDPLNISLQEDHVMRILLLYGKNEIVVKDFDTDEEWTGKVSEYIISDLQNEQIKFENDLYNQMMVEYKTAEEKGLEPDELYFINHQNPKIAATTIELVTSQYQLSEKWKQNKIYVKTEEDQLSTLTVASVLTLKSRLIGKQLKSLVERMKVANDEAEVFLLQQEFFGLKSIANQIDYYLTRTFSY
jgi:DNA primase